MKTVRDVMTTDIIWLSPTNKIKTAIILMKGRNIGGLPVLEDERIVGTLDYQDVLGKDSDIPVQHIMNKEFVTIPPQIPIADAADLMTQIGDGRLLVTENGRLVGIVTRGDILPELGKSVDLLTGLPRADAMRDWGINVLKSGQEISVIFMDLDDFGNFNKKYGHIIGDNVIKHVSDILKSQIDDNQDMLCRYAGDEFVIVSTRLGEEAYEFSQKAAELIRSTENPQLPEPVTITFGVYGGKRTKEREQVHYESTLDNLINLASKACTLSKKHLAELEILPDGSGAAVQDPEISQEPIPSRPESHLETPSRLIMQNLNISWDSGSIATVEVTISNGTETSKRSRSGYALGNNAVRLVADAAAEAVSDFLSEPGSGLVAENIHVINDDSGDKIALVTVLIHTPQRQERVSGSSIIKQDAYRATAAALLDAVNRQISKLI